MSCVPLGIISLLGFIVAGTTAQATTPNDDPMRQCRERKLNKNVQVCCESQLSKNCWKRHNSEKERKECIKREIAAKQRECCLDPGKHKCDEKTAFERYCYKVQIKNDASVILKAEVLDVNAKYQCDGDKHTGHFTQGFTSNTLTVANDNKIKISVVSTNKSLTLVPPGSFTITCKGALIFNPLECWYMDGSVRAGALT